MSSRSRQEIIEMVTMIEQYMLQGYTSPSALMRVQALKAKGLNRPEAQSYIDAIHARWAKGITRHDTDEKRAALVEQHMQNLRQSYVLLAELSQSTLPTAASEKNRTIANITKILSAVADLQGLRERTLRIGGDREQIPVQIQQQDSMVLQAMVTNGQLDRDTADALDRAIIAARTGERSGESGGLRLIESGPGSGTPSSGDYSGGSTGEME